MGYILFSIANIAMHLVNILVIIIIVTINLTIVFFENVFKKPFETIETVRNCQNLKLF